MFAFLGVMIAPLSSTLAQGQSLSNTSSKDNSWFDKHQQGWHFYKKRPQSPKPKKLVYRREEEAPEPQSRPKEFSKNFEPESYTQKLKAFQEKLEEAQARAVLNPTVENVQEFARLHDAVINQADRFQETWLYTTLLSQNPKDANYMSPKGREIKDQQEEQELERRIVLLAREHGLFFVFKEGCPYCNEFAPLVKAFAKKYGFEVKAISADGGKLPEFPEAEMDNGIVSLINPDGVYPALYIVNPAANSVFPLSWGMVNEVGLKDNIKHYLVVKDREIQ